MFTRKRTGKGGEEYCRQNSMLQGPFVQCEQGVPDPGSRPVCLQHPQLRVHRAGQSWEECMRVHSRGTRGIDHTRPYEEFLSSLKKNAKPLKEFREPYRITSVVLKNKLKRNWKCLLRGGFLFLDAVHIEVLSPFLLAPFSEVKLV